MPGVRLGVDIGGTFTDIVLMDEATGALTIAKVPSVPADPAAGLVEAIRRALAGAGASPDAVTLLIHGTTIVTNAVLEGKLPRTALVTTEGFRDVLEIGRHLRPDMYDLFQDKPTPIVPRDLRFGARERTAADGAILVPLAEPSAVAIAERLRGAGVEAVAICFLHAYANPANERAMRSVLAACLPEVSLSASSDVCREIREYERSSTVALNAATMPLMARYLEVVQARVTAVIPKAQVLLMQSSGGSMTVGAAKQTPVHLITSGPAAGVLAAQFIGRATGRENVLGFDMGGTSTDISLVYRGAPRMTTEGGIGGHPVKLPMLEVNTIGAGGGSIAWLDPGGGLRVGPQSAGADPGPAAYRRGGDRPTVTDANLVLGALGEDQLLAGRLRMDKRASSEAIRQHIAEPLGLTVEDAAAGMVRIVNTVMAVDLRRALQDEGQDPRRFALVASGGAGPLHAAALARMLGIPRVLVPPHPGINCAMGLLQTEVRHSYIQSAVGVLATFPVERFNALLRQLEGRALGDAAQEGFDADSVRLVRQVDLRYLHQGYQITVPCPSRDFAEADKLALKRTFDDHHRRIYGQSAENEDAEVVSFRVLSEVEVPQLELKPIVRPTGTAAAGEREFYDPEAKRWARARLYDRTRLAPGDRLEGPAIILQFDSTTVVLAGQSAEVDAHGIIVIQSGARDDA